VAWSVDPPGRRRGGINRWTHLCCLVLHFRVVTSCRKQKSDCIQLMKLGLATAFSMQQSCFVTSCALGRPRIWGDGRASLYLAARVAAVGLLLTGCWPASRPATNSARVSHDNGQSNSAAPASRAGGKQPNTHTNCSFSCTLPRCSRSC
jgi:hypothetical protein